MAERPQSFPVLVELFRVSDLTGGDVSTTRFNGSILSSTDSYLDGIIDYFLMKCEIRN